METVIAPEEEFSRGFLPTQSNQQKSGWRIDQPGNLQLQLPLEVLRGFWSPQQQKEAMDKLSQASGMAGCRFAALKQFWGPN